MQKFFKLEALLYVFVVVGILSTGSYLIFSRPEMKRVAIEQESLGFVRPQGQDVRLRGNQEAAWNKLGKEAHVYQDDRVFTGSSSSAIVKLRGDQQFTIEPNSLVKITDDTNVPVFDLENGSFFGELRKGTKFFIKSEQEVVQIESTGAVIRLESQKKKIKLTVFKGEASVKLEKTAASQKVKANEEAELEKQGLKIEPLKFTLVYPKPGAFVWKQSREPLILNWKTSNILEPTLIEVALDPLFKESILSQIIQGESLSANLKPGHIYFWRVKSSRGGHRSAVSSFSYYTSLGPQIIPKYTLPINVDARGVTVRPVNFSWRDESLSDSYELQVSQTENFSTILYSKETTALHQSVPGLRVGQYYWRVISKHPERENFISTTAVIELQNATPAPIESEIQPILATKPLLPEIVPLEKPQILWQNLNFELDSGSSPSEVAKNFVRTAWPTVRWRPSAQAERHELEFSAFENFRSAKQMVLERSPWVWQHPQVGLFYIRLKAIRGNEVAYSDVRTVRTLVASPQLVAKVSKPEDGILAKVKFNLDSHRLSKRAEIQTSEDESFIKAQVVTTEKDELNYFPSKPGVVFVRARSLNTKGWPISKFSAIQKIEIPKINYAPEIRQLASTKKPAEATTTKLPLKDPMDALRGPKFNMWFGAGGDFLQFSQSGNEELSTGTFSKMMAPAIMLGVGFRVADKSKVNLQYHDAPGELSATTDTDVKTTSYHWRSAIAEWQYEILNRGRIRYNVLFGGQVHQIPFIYVDDLGAVSVLQNELSNLSIGFKADYKNSSGYIYEAFMRYQQLVGSRSLDGNSFSAQSQLMFDGSIGVTKLYSSGISLGAFWFGQSQNIRYTFIKDDSRNTGVQSFFGSTFQLRFGYDFF